MNKKYLWLVIAIVCVSIGLALYFGLSHVTESIPSTGARIAAEKRDAMAQWDLGVMYRAGLGVPEDKKKAVKW
jgi:TPR repeat protein